MKKKNEIVDCNDVEATTTFKHDTDDESLFRDFGHFKPKTMPDLMEMMTRFCAGEDTRLAKKRAVEKTPGSSDTKDGNGKSRRNCRNKCQAGGGKKRQFQGKKGKGGNSTLDKILDQPCDIHGPKKDGDPPATHTNQNCWVHKKAMQSGKGNADKPNPCNKDDEDEPQPGKGNGGQKQFPLQIKYVNMIYPSHTSKKERKRALRKVYERS